MADIFISYSRKDSQQAEQLAELLASAGLSCWIDKEGIDIATSWSGEIVDAINDCKAFVVLLSPNSIESHNVIKEVSLASEKRKKILPLDLEPVTLTRDFEYQLAGIQRAPMTNIDTVIRTLGKLGLRATQAPSVKLVKEADSRKSLMILPFEDLSPTADNAWFADGIVSEMISALSNVKALRVADSQTTKEFKKYNGHLTNYANVMNIRYFVQGDVRKFGDQIKISVRLLDIETGDHLWQDSMKGIMDDIFDIQEKVALSVVEGLKVHLASDEKKKLAERGTENAEAYELVMRASSYGDLSTKQSVLHAIQLCEEAIRLDPDYIRAYTLFAYTSGMLYRSYIHDEQLLLRGEQAVQEALRRKPDSVSAHSTLGILLMDRGKGTEAIEEAKKAIALDPNNFASHFQLGLIYSSFSRTREATEAWETALELYPEYIATYFNLAIGYYMLGDAERLKQIAERALPHFEKFVRSHPDDQHKRTNFATLLFFAGHAAESKREMDSLLSLPSLDGLTYYSCACNAVRLQEYTRALEFLDRAVNVGFINKTQIVGDSALDPLHDMPGWEQILYKLDMSVSGKQAEGNHNPGDNNA